MKMRTALIAALSAALLAGSACSKPQSTAPQPPAVMEPTPSTTAPDPTILGASDGEVVHLTLPKGEPVTPNVGLFTLDRATGQVDAWTLAKPFAPQDIVGAFFSASPDGRRVVGRTREKGYIAERTGGDIQMYRRNQYELVALSAQALVFEATDGGAGAGNGFMSGFGPAGYPGTGKFTVLGADLSVRTSFTLPLTTGKSGYRPGLLSPDGTRLAVADETALYLVDLTSGKHTAHALPRGGVAFIQPEQGGQAFRLVPIVGDDPRSYTWTGEALPKPPSGDLAPGGKLTAAEEWIASLTPTLAVRDAKTGQPLFRVLGAETYYGYGLGGSHWTADGAAALFHGRDGIYLVSADGRLRRPAAFSTGGWHEPYPSPTDARLFADRVYSQDGPPRLEIVDEAGAKAQSITFTGDVGGLWPTGPLWHPTGAFVQISYYNAGGRDGRDYAIPVAPAVEKAPFATEPTLAVADTGDCLNVRATPSTSAAVVACLTDGTKVTAAVEFASREGHDAQTWGDGHQWLFVQVPGGKAGWAAVDAGYLTWAP